MVGCLRTPSAMMFDVGTRRNLEAKMSGRAQAAIVKPDIAKCKRCGRWNLQNTSAMPAVIWKKVPPGELKSQSVHVTIVGHTAPGNAGGSMASPALLTSFSRHPGAIGY